MGLGNFDNFDIGNFTPKASRTAANLVSVSLKKENTKKNGSLILRVQDDVLQLFKETCESNGTTMSDVLRAYIETVITNGRF